MKMSKTMKKVRSIEVRTFSDWENCDKCFSIHDSAKYNKLTGIVVVNPTNKFASPPLEPSFCFGMKLIEDDSIIKFYFRKNIGFWDGESMKGFIHQFMDKQYSDYGMIIDEEESA